MNLNIFMFVAVISFLLIYFMHIISIALMISHSNNKCVQNEHKTTLFLNEKNSWWLLICIAHYSFKTYDKNAIKSLLMPNLKSNQVIILLVI